jgi:Rrf2 family protein
MMRISAKGRYALAALIFLAQQYNSGEYITTITISEKLGISKIYLEQVFALLKKAELVFSSKGSQGGYKLSRMPREITVLDVLSAVEVSLFEQTHDTVPEKAPEIEKALKDSIFVLLDRIIIKTLKEITLAELVSEAERHKKDQAMMFYI